MQLNSFAFFGFFAVIFILYWLAAPHWRVPLLFCASIGFYALFGIGTTVLLLGAHWAVSSVQRSW